MMPAFRKYLSPYLFPQAGMRDAADEAAEYQPNDEVYRVSRFDESREIFPRPPSRRWNHPLREVREDGCATSFSPVSEEAEVTEQAQMDSPSFCQSIPAIYVTPPTPDFGNNPPDFGASRRGAPLEIIPEAARIIRAHARAQVDTQTTLYLGNPNWHTRPSGRAIRSTSSRAEFPRSLSSPNLALATAGSCPSSTQIVRKIVSDPEVYPTSTHSPGRNHCSALKVEDASAAAAEVSKTVRSDPHVIESPLPKKVRFDPMVTEYPAPTLIKSVRLETEEAEYLYFEILKTVYLEEGVRVAKFAKNVSFNPVVTLYPAPEHAKFVRVEAEDADEDLSVEAEESGQIPEGDGRTADCYDADDEKEEQHWYDDVDEDDEDDEDDDEEEDEEI